MKGCPIAALGLWSLFSLLSLLAGCEFASAPQDPVRGGNDADLVVDDSLGFRLRLPAGWSGSGPGQPPLRMTLAREEFQDFQAKVTVVAGVYPEGASPLEVIRAMGEAKFAEHGSACEILTEDTLTVGGLPGAILGYTLPSEGGAMRAEQVIVQRGATLLILTSMERKDLYPDRLEEFRAIRASLAFP